MGLLGFVWFFIAFGRQNGPTLVACYDFRISKVLEKTYGFGMIFGGSKSPTPRAWPAGRLAGVRPSCDLIPFWSSSPKLAHRTVRGVLPQGNWKSSKIYLKAVWLKIFGPGPFKRDPGPFKRTPGPFKRALGPFKRTPGPFKRDPGPFKRDPGPCKRTPGPFQRAPGPF